ncbi:hypothetical protein RvY_18292-2 [Ramazzottius varieornatus]|uniref:Zinc transporter ZIP4 N-terminal domain-containing protein n=1 Tax=Ramazzottius varieornatus TaxID=947166 RepID=A0A1D1W8K1_RAMVA|nr:hypothetical protein RvY_18292-2 [Ramazzottius varieornatus]
MDCCHHSFHKKEHQDAAPRFLQISSNVCYCLLLGLGVLCCHVHCAGAFSIATTFKHHGHDARTARHPITHHTDAKGSNRHGPNATLPAPNEFLSMLFDIKLVNDTLAMSDQRLENITRKLKIGVVREHHVYDSPDDNPIRRAKNAAQAPLKNARHDGQEELSEEPLNGTCWSVIDLRRIFKTPAVPMPVDQFQQLCPALIHQAYFDTCLTHPADWSGDGKTPLSSAKTYGYGTVAVVLSSSLSMVGIVIIPFLGKRSYKYAMQGFIALGVGALAGDALLHLLPEALHLRDDTAESEYHRSLHSHDGEEALADSNLAFWRMVACGAAIYVFFLWEVALHSFIERRTKKAVQNNLPHNDQLHHHHHGHDHEHSHIPDRDAFRAPQLKASVSCSSSVSFQSKEEKSDTAVDVPKHQEEGHKIFGMKPLAWIIFLGDALHNFADGLAIAAAFSDNVSSGIATTVAIFCHEIPHELGDFALLLSTGLSFKRVLFLNVVTAGISLLGFYIGVPIAQQEQAREWILTITAGTFLYVALADMVQYSYNSILNSKTEQLQRDCVIFCLAS